MSLRPYDDVAANAGLTTITSQFSGIPIVSAIAPYVSTASLKIVSRLFGVMMVGWMFLLFFGFVFSGAADNSGFPFVMFCGFFAGPVIIGIVLVGGYGFLMSTLFTPPELMITEVQLKRDDTFDIRYQQNFKRGVTLKSVAYTLILRETATYQQGTSTVTEHHDNIIDERVEFEVHVDPNSPIDEPLTFTIPPDAMHTFETERNKLNWFLRVSLDIPSFPDFRREYRLRIVS